MSHVSSPTTRFTAAEFERMVEADVFGTQRVELINGRVYHMSPQNDPHQFAIGKINRALSRVVPANEMLLVPGTLRLNASSVVDPDLVWIAAPYGTSEDARPMPLLVIEVSDSTYKKDSGIKLRAYAKFGIAEYWIVNVRDGRIEVYSKPEDPTGRLADCRFASRKDHERGTSVALLQRPEISFAVDELLP